MQKIFNIEQSDIVSVTGAGGKTSLILALAQDLKKCGPVLVTTSTKMRITKSQVDHLHLGYDPNIKVISNKSYGIFARVNEKSKQEGLRQDQINGLKDKFSYILVEADGSRMLDFKFWKDHEPVIYNNSTKAIGVFSIKMLGQNIGKNNTYKYQDYIKYTKTKLIDEKLVLALVDDDNTYFKDHKGQKIFFINQVESPDEKILARKLVLYLSKNSKRKDLNYVYGSVKNGKYYKY